MPKYAYRCEKCGAYFETVHSIKKKLTDCEECEIEGTLKRVPFSLFILQKDKKPGTLVGKHIEETRKEVSEEKDRLRKTEHE